MHKSPSHTEQLRRIEGSLLAPEEYPDRRGELVTIDELLERFLVPGCSLAIIADGEIVASQGYGATTDGGAAIAPNTIFQACSISKAVAGVGAMRLVQDGLFDLDADVNDYLSSWTIPANNSWQPRVTLRHLLTHTAGLNYYWFPGYRRGTPTPTALQTLNGEAPANTPAVRVVGLPGAEFRYSGAHYAVLQFLLEEITGEPFPELMARLIFEPLEMHDSSYNQSFPETRPDGVAFGHNPAGVSLNGGWHLQPEYAGAGLWTTPADLCRLAIAVQRARSGDDSTLLNRELTAEMLTPGPGDRGLGWQMRSGDGWLWFEHSGGNVGYRCHLLADAESGRGAAVMTNNDAGWPCITALFDAIGRELGWPDEIRLDAGPDFRAPQASEETPDQSLLDACAGTYRLETGLELIVEADQRGLTLRAGDQPRMALLPVNETTFLVESANATLAFEPNPEKNAATLRFRQFGDDITAERIE